MEQIFTFGFGHSHPKTGEPLSRRYVVIQGENFNDCRSQMVEQFGQKWSMQYDTREAAGVSKFGLREISLHS